MAEEQVPEHLDRTHLLKRNSRRTLYEFDFAIERAETTGTYGKPAEHWQRFRDAIRSESARQVEKFTRRGKSVAWEIDVDATLYRIPNPDAADVVNTIQKMAQKRALVAATLIATSASEFFTQDMEDADPSGRNLDTGAHPHGTREAQECVRDHKLEELRSKPVVTVEPDASAKPWKNFGEMRRVFEQLREQVGETRYLEELELAGVQNPRAVPIGWQVAPAHWRFASSWGGKEMKRPRIDVNLSELDQLLDKARQAPLSEPDCHKIKTTSPARAIATQGADLSRMATELR